MSRNLAGGLIPALCRVFPARQNEPFTAPYTDQERTGLVGRGIAVGQNAARRAHDSKVPIFRFRRRIRACGAEYIHHLGGHTAGIGTKQWACIGQGARIGQG